MGVRRLPDRFGGDVVDVDFVAGFRGSEASEKKVRVSIIFGTHASHNGVVKAAAPTNADLCVPRI